MTLSLNLAQLALLLTPDGAGNVLAKQSPTLGDNSLKLATTAYVVGGFAPLVSPVFSGTPQGTTAPLGDNSTRLATTAYVNTTLLSASGIALSGANVTLTSSQYGVLIIKLTGTLTTNVSVTFPTSGRWEVYNTCTMGGFTITLTNGVGANVAITSQGAYTVLSDASAGMLQTNSTASGGVTSFNTRTGAVTLQASDVTGVGGALLASPAFTGTPTAPTAAIGTNNTQLATTNYVYSATQSSSSIALTNANVTLTAAQYSVPVVVLTGTLTGNVTLTVPTTGQWTIYNSCTMGSFTITLSNGTGATVSAPTGVFWVISNSTAGVIQGAGAPAGVTSFNTRTGAVTLTSSDITGAGGALLASPAFTGTPTAPTAATGTSSTQLATTAFVYTSTSAQTSVALASSNVTLTAAQYSVPIIVFTGTLTANVTITLPTTGQWTVYNNTSGAFTVTLSNGSASTMFAPQGQTMEIVSVTGTGILQSSSAAVTPVSTDNSQRIATTAYVQTNLASYAPLASPALTGTPTVPTAAVGTNNTQIASTAYVYTATQGSATINLSGSNVTLTAAQYSVPVLYLTGTLTANVTITVPTTGTWTVYNTATQGSFTITISNGTGSTVTATAGAFTIISNATGGVIPSGAAATVTSFNSRTGAVTLQASDVTGVGGALLASPAFTGTPTAPTASIGTNSTQLATTAYVYAAMSTETSVALASSNVTLTAAQYSAPILIFTGTLTANVTITFPTTGQWTVYNNTSGAFTVSLSNGGSNTITATQGQTIEVISVPSTGILQTSSVGVTPSTADNSTKLATTAYVQSNLASYAPLASPTFTGLVSLSNANLTLTATTLATSGANVNSPQINLISNYWNGSASAQDTISLYANPSTGTNPVVTLNFGHPSGSSGGIRLAINSTAFLSGSGQFIGPSINTAGAIQGGSLAITGTATGVTPSAGDNSTNFATTAFAFNLKNGVQSVSVAGSSNVTLTAAQYGAGIITLTGTLTGNISLFLPAQGGNYTIYNGSTGSFTITCGVSGGGTTVVLPQSAATTIMCDGTNTRLANSGQAFFNRYSFTATASQTTFSVSYTPGNILVLINGAVNSTSNYTASNGTSVVLNSALFGGEDVEIFAFSTFSVANALALSGGTLTGPVTFTGSDTTVTQAASDNSTKLATTAYVQTAVSVMRGRNKVINGSCQVQQRGAGVAVTGTANTYGQVDRFCGSQSGSNGQYTLSASTITYGGIARPCVLATCNTPPSAITGSSYWAGVDHFFEGINVFDLIGQPISVSFIFQSNTSGTFSVSLRDNATANSYTTTFAATANTPLKVSFTAPANNGLSIANDTSARFSIMIGGLNTGTFSASTLNAWVTGGNYFSATTVTNWASSANNYIAIAELQVEAASAPTTFERFDYGYVLRQCQRYYEVAAVQNSLATVYATGFASCGSLAYKVNKRATPTVTVSGISTTTITISSLYNPYPGTDTCGFAFNTSSAINTSGLVNFTAAISAEL